MMSEPSKGSIERSTSSTPQWSSTWIEDGVESGSQKTSTRRLQPNLTRRSHKKSRAGCFTCKTRKIKCGEERPQCAHCRLKSSECVYPSSDARKDQAVVRKSISLSPTLSSNTSSFSLQDMQFFHHFLTLAYPHLPLGNESVWVREIPQFAQEHCYLMHAMLALGASHLARTVPNESAYDNAALIHRGQAIAGLNKALAKSDLVYGEADALLATCYALTFQSTYMPDGLPDFITFVRGCALATGKIRNLNAETAFDIRPDRHFDIVRPRLRCLPPVNLLHILNGLEGLKAIQPYLSNTAEYNFYNALHSVYTALQTSPQNGYLNFIHIFMVWHDLPHEDFQQLLNPKNITAQLLLAYFVSLELLMVPLTINEWPRRAGYAPARAIMGVVSWSYEIAKKVPPSLQHHLDWPRSIVARAVAEVSGLPFEGPAVLLISRQDMLLDEYQEFMTDGSTQAQSPG